MRQLLVLVLASALMALSALVPLPEPPGEGEVVVRDYPGVATGVGFCPGWTTDGEVESDLFVTTVDPIEVVMSWQADDEVVALRSGRDDPGTFSGSPGFAQGYVPVVVERVAGAPVTAGVVTAGPSVLAASACARWSTTRWVVGIGGTLEGEQTILILHNPSAQTATVTVETYSEQGFEVAPTLSSVTVPPTSRLELDVTGDLRLRERVVFVVEDPLGAVVPVLEHRNRSGDRGITTGVPEASGWYFPQTVAGSDAELVVVNPASFEVAVEIDRYGTDGVDLSADVEVLAPRSIWVVGVPSGTAVHVRADNAIGAAMRHETESGLALSMGLEAEATAWMLPGAGVVGATSTLHVLNTSTEPVAVTYRVLGPGGATEGRDIEVPPLSVVARELDVGNAAGVSLVADAPLTVAWSAVSEDGGRLAVDVGVPGG